MSFECSAFVTDFAWVCTCPKTGSALRTYLRRARAAEWVAALRNGDRVDDESGIRMVIPDRVPLPPWARPWAGVFRG